MTVLPYYYRDSTVHTVIDALSTALACLLTTVPAFVLYFIQSPVARLGGIVIFTAMFSVVLAVITRARRVERFAATTASVVPNLANSRVTLADSRLSATGLRQSWSCSLATSAMPARLPSDSSAAFPGGDSTIQIRFFLFPLAKNFTIVAMSTALVPPSLCTLDLFGSFLLGT